MRSTIDAKVRERAAQVSHKLPRPSMQTEASLSRAEGLCRCL